MAAMIISPLLLMIAAIIIRSVSGRKLGGKILMLMWAIVFIRLAVPVSIPSAVSVMNLFSAGAVSEQNERDTAYSEDMTVIAPHSSETEAAPSSAAPGQSEMDPRENDKTEKMPEAAGGMPEKADTGGMLFNVYVAVAVILGIAAIAAYIICAVRFSGFDDIEVPEGFSERGLSFKKSDLATPAVFGIFRPMILIPERTDISDSKPLEHIILHEKTHIRHKDQLWGMLTLMICCANWYDPLVWVCRRLYLKDAEKWCDEAVIEVIGNENRKEYAGTLLACAEERSRPFMLISGFGESDIKARIKAILENKRLRGSVSALAVILIIIIGAVLGTGRAVRAEMTFSDFVPADNGWDYTQKFTGNNGEAAAVTLNLNNDYDGGEFAPANYYHFTLGIDSGEYSVCEPHAEIKIKNVESFRVIPDGKRNDSSAEITYNADFNKGTNDIELAISFAQGAEPNLTADISYKLKKGIFTVGTYAMNVEYDLRALDKDSYVSGLDTINKYLSETGFEVKTAGKGYEISSTDGSTDLRIGFNDLDDGAVVTNGKGNELILSGFNPYYSEIRAVDVTNDGVNDLVLTTRITGTGVIQNLWDIIDGARLCEIPVDTEGVEHIITGFVNSGAFADFAAGVAPTCQGFDFPEGAGISGINTDEIFTETDPHLIGNLFLDKENENKSLLTDNIRIYGGIFAGTEGRKITGSSVFGLVRNGSEYSDVYFANVVFRYEDGSFKAVDIEFVNNTKHQ